jgi:tetraacyldisaccharide 4'-kinase
VAALAPLAWLYGALVRLRNRRFDRPGAVQRAGLPVISVGNITVGGTGKTPVVAWLARRLRSAGLRGAVVSRGYGGRAGRGPLTVSTGDGPLCGAEVCGDEPYELALALPETVVVVGSDRVAGVKEARRQGARVALLDDGYQHRRLARDLDLLLLDATDPFGNRRLLPAGPLREPLGELRRADLVLITRSGREETHPAIEREVRRHNPGAPLLRAGHRIVGFVDRSGQPVERPGATVAFCGIGNPDRFREDLGSSGVGLVELRVFTDHHVFSAGEIEDLRGTAEKHEAALVTTEKDLARLGGTAAAEPYPGILALRIEAEPFEPELLLDAALGAARGGGE